MKMGLTGCPETQVRNKHPTLHLQRSRFLNLENGNDKLSCNVGKELPRLTA